MNVDAQEAALGLLCMGYNYLSQPTPSTSSATLNSILTTTASPVIPQKRKQSDIDQPESASNHVELIQQQQSYLRLTHSPPTEPSPRSNGAESHDCDPTEAVDCICGFSNDDGFSIACDECSRWCHSACFGIAPGSVPEKFACWTCKPRSVVEKEQAVRLQREKLGMADGDGKEAKQRRRSSPELERKPRRGPNSSTSTAPADGAGPGKRKRRPSIMQQPPTPTVNQVAQNGAPEEEQVEIDNEPWKEYYVHIVHDIIPNDDTRAKLRHQAAHWRGVTAVSSSPQNPAIVPSSSLDSPPPVSIKPLSPQSSLNPFLSQNSNPLVLPPAFSLHTTRAIPSRSFITPFRSCVMPSSAYLADPLNAYAHLGMPKPYVHLLGPPLDVALDARIVGNHGRFARWGCKPNAVLRPILCERGSKDTEDEGTLTFGVFATKDMKANEEIVLGWEWDDGNAVHLLPALLEAPDAFPPITPLQTNRPHTIQHIKNQMSNILHALSSTFTTCACGALSKDCALTQMAAFVDGHDLLSLLRKRDQLNELDSEDETTKIDIGPLVGRKRGFRTRERIPFSGGLGGMQMAADEDVPGNGKGFVWDGRQPYKEGISPSSMTSFPFSPGLVKRNKERALTIDEDTEMMEDSSARGNLELSKLSKNSINNLIVSSQAPSSGLINNPPSEPRPPDPPDGDNDGEVIADQAEERMPPKMRKKWMHRKLEARKEHSAKVGLGITVDSQDDHQLMPPPPMPASMDPTTISSISAFIRPVANRHSATFSLLSPTPTPSASIDLATSTPASGVSPLASFAQLSLLSPALNSEISCQPGPPTQDEEKAELLSREDSKADTVAADVMDATEANLPTARISSGERSEDGLVEERESINDPLTVLDSHASGLSRTPSIYLRCHDEDDEVDYSPHSPEPSAEDDGESREVLPSNFSETPEVTESVSNSVTDDPSEPRKDFENCADDQAKATDSTPLPISSPTSLLSTVMLPGSTTNSEHESSENPSFEDQSQPQPPPPKVKLTLKDFALRRKRQREEQALSQSFHASPVPPSPLLEVGEEAKSSNAQPEVSEPRGSMVVDDLHQVPSKGIDDSRHVVNGVKDLPRGSVGGQVEFTLESRNVTNARQKEFAHTTVLNSTQSTLPLTPSFPKPAASTPTNGPFRPPLSHDLPNRPPPLQHPRPIQQQYPAKTTARDMKQELIETLVPTLLQRVCGIERSVSPISPDPAPMVNRISQEEGEIGEVSMPRGSSKRDPSKPSSRNGPFSHSPPTAPRLHLIFPPVCPLPSISPVPSTASNNSTNGNPPNLPTAPRALRQSMLHHRSGSGPPTAFHPPSFSIPSQSNSTGSPFIPRGPFADRDKDRDRAEWEQRHYRAPPRRGAGSGRGTWGR